MYKVCFGPLQTNDAVIFQPAFYQVPGTSWNAPGTVNKQHKTNIKNKTNKQQLN